MDDSILFAMKYQKKIGHRIDLYRKVHCLHENKILRFVAHQRPWSEDREKKQSIKLFLFYIFSKNYI